MTAPVLTTVDFFSEIKPFTSYREKVYEASEQTITTNLTDIRLFQNFVNAGRYKKITTPVIMDFQLYLKQDRLNNSASINRKIFSLKSYTKYLNLKQVKGARELPIWDILKIRQGYRNKPGALTVKQIQTLFKSIDRTTCLGIRDYCIYALMYNLGLRIGEVHNLNLDDIDFNNSLITVIGKGLKHRTLHLTDEMTDIITEWLLVRERFMNNDKVDSLFISKKGNRLAIRTIEDNFKKKVLKSGIKAYFNITPHTLRHSFASHLNDKEVDILILQSLLGHSTPRSTEIYIHPSDKRIRQALEKMPGVKYMKRLLKLKKKKIYFQ